MRVEVAWILVRSRKGEEGSTTTNTILECIMRSQHTARRHDLDHRLAHATLLLVAMSAYLSRKCPLSL